MGEGGAPVRRRARLGTVRARATAASMLLVGLALVAGATGLVLLLQRSLTDQVRAAAELRAEDAADALSAGDTPSQVARGDDEVLIQVVAVDGTVLAATPNVRGPGPVRPVDEEGAARVTAGPTDDLDQFLVVTRPATSAGRDVVVLVGRALDPVRESSGVVLGLLAAGLPLLLVVVGITTWWVAGRVLAPVEAIRSEVEEISAAQLHRRVPSRPGGDEISRLAVTMNQMLARLERAQLRQRRFVSDASHEVRSPVAAIRQQVEVAIAHPDSTTSAELGATVRRDALRVQRLVEDLLLLARADEGRGPGVRRQVDLDDLVLGEARRAGLASTVRVDQAGVSAARVEGDPGQLAQAVRNVVDNAVRHARAAIVVSVAEDGGEAVLTVEDDGPGIPAEDRARVLDRFVRLDEARARDAGGSGLGLAIVAEVVAAHGGTVTITEAVGGGARVELRFPVAVDGPA